jgi:hypothetical protein
MSHATSFVNHAIQVELFLHITAVRSLKRSAILMMSASSGCRHARPNSAFCPTLVHLYAETKKRCGSDARMTEDERRIDDVPPANGRPEDQHDQMVENGLCKMACK